MAKYSVKCYFICCDSIDVEANSPKEAADIGCKICENEINNEFNVIDTMSIHVENEEGTAYDF